MGKAKRLIIIMLAIMLIISVTEVRGNAASADVTVDQAMSWCESKIGKKVGSGQCVAFIQAYYTYLGKSPVSGNACDYATNSLPSGWSRVKGGVPKKGDILVYTGAKYGHVAIYAGGTTSYHQNMSGQYVEKKTSWNYDKSWYSSAEGGTKSYWGYIRPTFATTTYTDHIALWAFGFEHGEGNNSNNDCFKVGECTIQKEKGASFKFTTSMNKVTIPNGYALDTSQWGSSGFTSDSSWHWYSFNDTVTQPGKDTWVQYNCHPVQYTITYNLNGGTNNSGNPATYNVLYGVTLQNPVKEGYVFAGWTDGSGNKVTGINEGANATFSSPEDMISKLAARKTGNLTLTANWTQNQITLWAQGFKNGEGNNNAKNCYYLGESKFGKNIGETYKLTPDLNKVTVPNGYVLNIQSWGSDALTSDGSWKWYSFDDSITQPAKDIRIQFDCRPVQYTITYNLNGGTNNEANPETYNVLYGVTLQDPVREGYTFDGWTDNSGNKITGINAGANATFSSVNDLMNQLSSRTTGDLELTAVWTGGPAEPLVITEQPTDVTASSGERVNLSIGASGSNLTYQWQWSADGKAWKNCTSAGYNTDTFSFSMREALDGRKYRCRVSDGSDTLYSDAATITLRTAVIDFELLAQPEDIEAAIGERVSFKVTANKAGVTYQWQWSSDGSTWKNCTSAGYNTDTFGFTMKASLANRLYRCVVSDENTSLTSNSARVTLKTATELTITEQPEDTSAAIGKNIVLTVKASGENLNYQWQWSADGNRWKNCSSAGYNTNTFSFTMKSTLDGRHYRCVVSSGSQSVTSDIAIISIAEDKLRITEQPEDYVGSEGDTVELHVAAEGQNLSYQWQWSTAGSSKWKNCSSAGFNTDTFRFSLRSTLDGRLYRCEISDDQGNKVTSEAAEIRISGQSLDTSEEEETAVTPKEALDAPEEQVTEGQSADNAEDISEDPAVGETTPEQEVTDQSDTAATTNESVSSEGITSEEPEENVIDEGNTETIDEGNTVTEDSMVQESDLITDWETNEISAI